MASRDPEEAGYDEKTAIRHSFSQEPLAGALEDCGATRRRSEWFYQRIPKRYVVAVMAFLGFCNVYALRVNMSVAIVAMVKNHSEVLKNGSTIQTAEFNWDSRLRGLVLASFFWGYIITQLPAGYLSSKLGGKHLFGGGIMVAAVLTVFTPPVARLNVYFLIVLRVLEGIFEGVTYPCMHAIWSKWAPPLERSKLATFAFSGSYFGTLVALPLSGAIAESIGWSWIFYVFGLLAMLWFLGWCYLVAESPDEHRSISTEELKYIQDSIGFTTKQTKGQKTPWRDMLLSLPVWAIVIAHFAENWGFYTLLTELPTFLNDVMHYDLLKAGTLAAIPYLVMCVMVQVGGQLADLLRRKQILSTVATRKLFNCGAFVLQAVFLVATAYAMKPGAAIACISLAVGFGGFAWSGFSVNHLDIAPQFASVLMGISNTFATIPGIVSPALTGHVAAHGTKPEWQVIFFLAAAIYVAGALFYAIFAAGERQSWAEIPSGYEPHTDEHEEND